MNTALVQTMVQYQTTGIINGTTHCHLVAQNSAQKRFHIINLYTLGC